MHSTLIYLISSAAAAVPLRPSSRAAARVHVPRLAAGSLRARRASASKELGTAFGDTGLALKND